MTELEIVGQLLEFLGRYSEKEFEATLKGTDAPGWLMECLHALASARRHLEVESRHLGRFHLELAVRARKARPTTDRGLTTSLDRSSQRSVRSLIEDTQPFASNRELCDYLNSLGLDIVFRPREGRKQIADKVLAILGKIPLKEQQRMLKRLFCVLPESETAGWFRAIRSPK